MKSKHRPEWGAPFVERSEESESFWRKEWRDIRDFLSRAFEVIKTVLFFALLIGSLAYILIAGAFAGCNHFGFDADMARIEQLRVQMETIREYPRYAQAEVIGAVVMANVEIVQMRTYNRKWWIGWAIPNGWNDVKQIEIN